MNEIKIVQLQGKNGYFAKVGKKYLPVRNAAGDTLGTGYHGQTYGVNAKDYYKSVGQHLKETFKSIKEYLKSPKI